MKRTLLVLLFFFFSLLSLQISISHVSAETPQKIAAAYITPSFAIIAPCPSCSSPTVLPSAPNQTGTNNETLPIPTSSGAEPTLVPCETENASIASHPKKSKHKKKPGNISKFMKSLLNFFIELLNALLKLLNLSPSPMPTEPQNPGSSIAPTSQPNPCSPIIPTNTAPTVPTVIPSAIAHPSSVVPTNIIASPPVTGNWWKPTAERPMQLHWQLSGNFNPATDFVPGATVYDIDGEQNTKAVVDAIHARGFKAICYFDAGVYEAYRSDASKFPQSVIGKNDVGWNDSYWLDIRQTAILLPIMEARIRDWCAAKGFDAVEPDEITNWSNDSGFPLTAADQIAYNKAIADLAHKYNLSVGLKGDQEQAAELEPYFDWNLTEECYQYNECNLISAFPRNNKATWVVEYAASPTCTDARSNKFNAMRRDLNLVGPTASGYLYQPCIPSGTTQW